EALRPPFRNIGIVRHKSFTSFRAPGAEGRTTSYIFVSVYLRPRKSHLRTAPMPARAPRWSRPNTSRLRYLHHGFKSYAWSGSIPGAPFRIAHLSDPDRA